MGKDQLSLWLMIRMMRLTRRRKIDEAVIAEFSSFKLCLIIMNRVKFIWRKREAKIVCLVAVVKQVKSSGWSCLAVKEPLKF